MRKPILFTAILTFGAISNLFAQVPVLNYAAPQVYKTGAAITLSPGNTGGAVPATTYSTVSTLVSSGLNNPRSIAYDGSANYYVADYGSNKILKVTSAGVVSVFAGSGTAAVTNGTGVAAAFNGPSGIAYVAGNLYVTDYAGSTVRKIVVSTAVVTTVAGLAGTAAVTNGTGTAARFNQPYGITSDGTNLYVTEFAGHTVRKIVISSTAVTTLSGAANTSGETDGSSTAARFTQPTGIVTDGTYLYVADYTGNTIRRVQISNGATTTIVASGLSLPNGLTFDKAGNLIIANAGNHTVKTCPVAGTPLTTLAGSGTQAEVNGVGTAAQFNTPFSLTNDAAGNIIIGDNISGSSTLRKLALTGYTISPTTLLSGLSFVPTTGVISGALATETTGTYTVKAYNASGNATATVTVTAATLPSISYATTTYNLSIGNAATIAAPTSTGGAIPATVYGTVSLYAGNSGAGSGTTNSTALTTAKFNSPSGIASTINGTLFVADRLNNRIRQVLPSGVTTPSGSTSGNTNGIGTASQYNAPTDVTTDNAGNVYIADFGNNQIRKLVLSTTVASLLAGSATGVAGSANNTGSLASFRGPSGIVYDAVSGALYVTDFTGNQIRKVTTGGVVTLFAGSTSNTAGTTNGTGSGASFSGPSGIVVDAAGNFYVADRTTNRIRKITQAGVVSTFAGSGTASSVDGTGTAATFNGPQGIAIDLSGNLYVSEATGNKIRMITPAGVVTTIAGSGTGGHTNAVGTAATFSAPAGLVIDPTTACLMVGDASSNQIRKIITTGYSISPALPTGLSLNSATGVISGTPTVVTASKTYTITAFNLVGSSSAQITISAQLYEPNISYTTPVSFLVSSAIATQSPTNVGGAVATFGFNTTGTQPLSGTFNGPYKSAIDASGNIYVLNYIGNSISKFSSTGTLITASYGTGAPALASPSGIVFDSNGNMYVLNASGTKIYKYNSSGAYQSTITLTGATTTYGLAIDASDNLYITSYSGTGTYRVFKYTTSTSTQSTFITTTGLNQPADIAIDPSGNVYVLNMGGNTVYKYNSAGASGVSFATGLSTAWAINVDEAGYVYVGDSGNNRILVYAPAGGAAIATITGITDPEGITIDKKGNIYASSYSGNKVYKFAPVGGYFLDKSLPLGLSFSATTGNITGTPTASSPATDYTVTAYNSTGGGSTIINITCYKQISWVGNSGVNNNWSTPGNWQGGVVPTSADQAVFSANYATQPSITANTNVGSVSIANGGGVAVTVTVTAATLSVSGDITYQSDAQSFRNLTATFTGTGSVTANNLNVIANTSISGFSYTQQVSSGLTNFNLSGNVNLTSTKPLTSTQNATFNVTGGTTIIGGNLITSNANGATSTTSVSSGTLLLNGTVQTANNTSGVTVISVANGATLKLAHADPLSTLGGTGTNTITLNTNSTVEYSGTDQTIYSDSTITGLPAGLSYKNIAFSGSGIKNATSGNLNIAGNFTNSLASNDSTTYVDLSAPAVNFNGTTQSLAGGTNKGTTFYAVNFSGAGTKTLASGKFNMDSGGVLTMAGNSASTILNAGAGLLTLKSDASGSATVAAIAASGPSITGSVNVQRYVTGNNDLTYRGYRLFSSAIADITSPLFANYNLGYLLGSGTYLTGASGGGFDTAGNPTIYLYREDETPNNTSFNAGNYRAITKINNTSVFSIGTIDGDYDMPVGNGFLLFYRGNNGTSIITPPASLVFSSTGRLNQGQVVVKPWFSIATSAPYYLSFNDAALPDLRANIKGFNLVGNPYPSSIDWNKAFGGTITSGIYAPNTDQTAYIYNVVSKNYDTYINTSANTGIGTNGMTNVIPQGQGFFVRAQNATAQLVFNESAKVTDQPDVLLLKSKVPFSGQRIRVRLAKDEKSKDETVLQFNSAAHSTFVSAEDALYLKGTGAVSLSNRSADNRALAINQLPFTAGTQTVRLNVAVTASGNYTMKITEALNLPAMYDVWLVDNYKKDSLDIKANDSYSFTTTADTATVGANRFKIVIRQNDALAVRLLSFTGTKTSKEIKLSWTVENEGNYTTYVLQRSTNGGSSYKTLDSLTSVSEGTYNDLDPNPVQGQNKYRLKQVDIFGNTVYSEVLTFNFEGSTGSPAQSNSSNLNVYPNPVRYILGLTIKPLTNKNTNYHITITNNMGIVVKNANTSLPVWLQDVSQIMPGTYFITVTDTRDNSLVGRTTFIKL